MEKRIVMMPFSYEVRGKRPKCKGVESFRYISAVPVEVETIASLDAPVAVSYPGADAFSDAMRRPFDLRLIGDALYGAADRFVAMESNGMEHHTIPERALLAAVDLEPMMQGVVDGTLRIKWPNYPIALDRSGLGFSTSSRNPRDSLRDVEFDDHDAARDRAGAAAQGAFVIVDGIVHVREHEPVWVVEHTAMPGTTTYLAYVRPARSWDEFKHRDAFRFDRLDDAIAFADTMFGATTPLPVRDAQLVHWDQDRTQARALEWGRTVVETINLSGNETIRLDSGFLMDLINLRRQIDEGTASLASVHGVVHRMIEAVDRSPVVSNNFRGWFKNCSELYLRRIGMFGHENADSAELDGFKL